jgi:uncharacterized membrane protein YfcA
MYILIGFIVGAMNAIAGGGMLVGFPALIALGTPALTANAVGYVAAFPGQVSSAYGYRKYLRKVPRKYLWLLLPTVLGAAIGSLALRYTSPKDFSHLIPVLVLFGVLLFAVQPLLHLHLHRHIKGKAKSKLPLIILSLAILPLSIYGGYFGAGYGLIMLAFLGFTNLHDAHLMNAMKNVAAIFLSGTVVICLYGSSLIDWHIGILAAIGSLIGGYAGARGAQRVSSHFLRLAIITIGLCAVAYLFAIEY